MQFPILQYLDVVIGLAVAMIVVATFVTAVTQFIMSVTYARARYLRDGLRGLIAQLDPSKLSDDARYLAELALRDETVGSKKLLPWLTAVRNWLRGYLPWWTAKGAEVPAISPASVIQREEWSSILLRLMSQAPAVGTTSDAKGTALQQLSSAVIGQNTFDAAAELKKIQKEILYQEAADPKAAASLPRARPTQAIPKRPNSSTISSPN